MRVVTYGEAEDADVRVLKVTPHGLTSEVTVAARRQELTFTVSVPGRHYAHNAVAALAAGVALGVPAAQPGLRARHLHRRQAPPPAQGRGGRRPGHRLLRPPPDRDDRRPGGDARRRRATPASSSSSSRTSSPAPRSWARRWARRWRSPTPPWSSTSIRPARTRSPGVTSALIIDAARAAGADVHRRPRQGRRCPSVDRGNGEAR